MAKMMKKAADGYTNYGKKSGKEDTYTDYAGKTSKPDSYTQYKKGGVVKKAKSGFGMLSVKAGIDKNPNPTFADKIAGAKKKEMKMGGKAAKQAAIAIAMKKAGKAPKKKMQYGGEAASMVPKGAKKMKSGGTVSMQLGSYDRQIGKNYTGKNVVNKGAKAKMGKSVGKCKNGC
jgi:hypothetical protein